MGRFIHLLAGIGHLVPITARIQACRDLKDDKILELAVNGQADAIITGDADLLVLHPFQGIEILSSSDWLGRQG